MPLLLLIETATSSCSVALSQGTKLLALKELDEQNIHASHITLFISEVMALAGKSLNELEAVVISMGPGSYTGLRIGVSTAKGICFALDIPLIAVNTLEGMAYGLSGKLYDLYCPMIDARRMEVYTAMFSKDMQLLSETEAMIVSQDSFSEVIKDKNVVFFGDGARKCSQFLGQATIIDNFHNSAANLIVPANRKFKQGKFENIASFEPYYLKDFVGTKPAIIL